MVFSSFVLHILHHCPDISVSIHLEDYCLIVLSENVFLRCRWFTGWEEYVGINRSNDDSIFSEQLNGGLPRTSCRPGIIDNSELVLDEADGESNVNGLRRNLQEGEDYRLVPQKVWKKLHEWYLFIFIHVLDRFLFYCYEYFVQICLN